MAKGLTSFFSKLQYSITPILQDRGFQEILENFKLPFHWSSFCEKQLVGKGRSWIYLS
jgi:hypothetical protein